MNPGVPNEPQEAPGGPNISPRRPQETKNELQEAQNELQEAGITSPTIGFRPNVSYPTAVLGLGGAKSIVPYSPRQLRLPPAAPEGEKSRTLLPPAAPEGKKSRTLLLPAAPEGEKSRTLLPPAAPEGEKSRTLLPPRTNIVKYVLLAAETSKSFGLAACWVHFSQPTRCFPGKVRGHRVLL